jgi:hypothetical protein
MSVHFDELEAYFVEMERDAKDKSIHDGIVRRVVSQLTDASMIKTLSTHVGYYARGQLVSCTIARGKVWARSEQRMTEADRATLKAIERDRNAIIEFCQQHGLDLRGGSFQ